MPLKVLGAGFGRTGTYSLKLALDKLGFGLCHHMYEVRQMPEQVRLWSAAGHGEKLDWDTVFAGFQSQVDWPASCFWQDLSVHYPDAKVILTDRDAEAWYESIRQTILPASEIGRTKDQDEISRTASEMIYNLVLQGIFEGRLGERDFAINKMRAHRQKVIDTIDPDRLLVFRVGDGWEPLCTFLGVETPNEPFPSGNSVKEFRSRKQYLDKHDT